MNKKRELRLALFELLKHWDAKDISIEARGVEDAIDQGHTIDDMELSDMPLKFGEQYESIRRRLSRWLNVDVRRGGSSSVSTVDAESWAREGGVRDHIIVFPLGTVVESEAFGVGGPFEVERVRIVGYRVKEEHQTSWDVVSPRCEGCDKATEYGDPVEVGFGIEDEEPYAVIYGKCCAEETEKACSPLSKSEP